MNSKFTDEQIKAYAAQFREGDAIWSSGKWCEVVVNGDFERLSTKKDCSKNQFIVNGGEEYEFEGAINGFGENSLIQDRYRVTTLEHYELQGGEKLVRLKYTCGRLTFGKSYKLSEVEDSDGYYWIIGDGGDKFYIHEDDYLDNWGIIPRYEQVKNKGKTTITEQVNEVVKDKMSAHVLTADELIRMMNEERRSPKRPASSHYHTNNNGNDVWQFADDNLSDERVKGFHQVNALKYIARYEKKHDTIEKRIEDLEKAKVSIDKLIELERKSEE